jgi:hypothetical protein
MKKYLILFLLMFAVQAHAGGVLMMGGRVASYSFPTTGILDNFTGSAGTTLHDHNSNWTQRYNGGLKLNASNQAVPYNDGQDGSDDWASIGPNCEAYETIVTAPTTPGFATMLGIRWVDATGNGYVVEWTKVDGAGNDTLKLWKYVSSGPDTQIGSTTTLELANGYKIGMSAIGSTISVYYDTGGGWTAGPTGTDTSYTDAGGVTVYISEGVIDNFGGGTL